MGQPVVHFEVIGKDGPKLRSYYSQMFGWEFQEAPGTMDYAVVPREGNTAPDGIGIGGGIGASDEVPGHVTFYVAVDDVEEALQKAESLGGERLRGPDTVEGTEMVLGHFTDPEGHIIGVVNPGRQG